MHADLQGRSATGRLWGSAEIFPGPAPETLQGGRERSAPYGASLQYQGKKYQLKTSFKALTIRNNVHLLIIYFIWSFAIILVPVLVDFYWFEQTHSHKYYIEAFILALNINDISNCVVYSEEVSC